MAEQLPDVDQLPKELDVLQLMRQKGYGPEVDEILELRSQNGKLHAWLALVRRDLAKREEFIESEFFQRVTYKQQLRKALDELEIANKRIEGYEKLRNPAKGRLVRATETTPGAPT